MGIMLVGTLLIGLAVAVFSYAGVPYYARWFGFLEKDFYDKLRLLRKGTQRLRFYLIVWLSCVAGGFLVLSVFFGTPVFGFLLAGLLLCFPWYLLRRMAEKRRQQIEDQLADSMVSLSSGIKAGLSLAQSIEILAQQSPHPIGQEFQQIYGEYRLGKPLERCLVEAKERLRSENFALFAAALEASRESGGRLNETVDRIAHSVRELQRLDRKVESETAQARSSAIYMAMAPLLILAVYYFLIDPDNTARLFTSLWGNILLSIAVIFNVVAYLWARVILNPDI